MKPDMMRQCEIIATLVCRASDLKSDDYIFKYASYHRKSCEMCEEAAYEGYSI